MTRWKTLLLLAAVLTVTCALARRPRVPRLLATIQGGKGPPTVVLLHGYGSSENDWVPFAKTISLPASTRFIFPRGPETLARSDGAPNGRAWWHLDLAPHMRQGILGADLSQEKPEGIENAAKAVRALLSRQGNQATQPFILGGFSQGAMVAAQVAFLSDEPLRALVILSGTLVDESLWSANYARREGLRVFMSHGRSDPTLSFAVADRMRVKMAEAGILVTWFPFDGGHEIPAPVVLALNEFFAHL